MSTLDSALKLKAFYGGLAECGDTGLILRLDGHCLLALIDVLGHGAAAYETAEQAKAFVVGNQDQDLIDLMTGLHRHLKGSRGAVASICRFEIATGLVEHVGVGNISVRILGPKSIRLVSRDSVVGYGQIHPRLNTVQMTSGDVLLLHSDGIREHFDKSEILELLPEDADTIARGIMERYRSGRDDASCLVMKFCR